MNLPLQLRGEYIHTLGREHLPPPGTKLVVAGAHVSALDPFIIAKVMPGHHVQFMSKKELFKPVIGAIIKAGGSFPVDRERNDVAAIRMALRILKEDGTLGLFPEGTRGGGQMQGGVALLALRGRAPVLPVGLRRDGKRWLRALRAGDRAERQHQGPDRPHWGGNHPAQRPASARVP